MKVQLKGITKLNASLDRLKTLAEEVKENLEIKQEWLNDKSEKYQDSDEGKDWEKHLSEVEELISDIENMDPIDLEN